MTTQAPQDEGLSVLSDDELRCLRKQTSMQQGHLESRLQHAVEPELSRVKRDMRNTATAYAKLQRAINLRLLGDEEDEQAA